MGFLARIDFAAWSAYGALVTAVSGFIVGMATLLTNRRKDTVTLYSSFVGDIRSELDRQKTMYDEERRSWTFEKDAFLAKIEQLEADIHWVRQELQKFVEAKGLAQQRVLAKHLVEEILTQLESR